MTLESCDTYRIFVTLNVFSRLYINLSKSEGNKMLSYRRETALQGAL